MSEATTARLSLRGAVRVVFRHKRKMTIFFLAVMGIVTAGTFLSPRGYRSQAKLFVRLGRENVILDPTTTLNQTPVVAVPQTRENEINSVIEILKSRSLLEQVVDRVGVEAILGEAPLSPGFTPGPPPAENAPPSPLPLSPRGRGERGEGSAERDRAVRALVRKVETDVVKKSNVILISYDGPSPEIAQAVVATLTEFYLDRHVRLNRTPGAQKFLAEQADRLRAELTRSEGELKDLQNRTGLIVSGNQKELIVARISKLEEELSKNAAALASIEAEVKHLRGKLASLSATQVTARTRGVANEAADKMREQLYLLQLKELELLGRHPSDHPEVRLIREQVASAKEILAREERTREHITIGPSKVFEETQLALVREEPALAALKAKEATLNAQLGQERASLRELNENSVRVAALQREVDLQAARYRKYSENLEQARIDRELEVERISNINIVQPATFDPLPVKPRRLLFLAAGFLLALLGSLGLAWLAERLDHSLKTPEDLETGVGLPVLGVIPLTSPHLLALSGRE